MHEWKLKLNVLRLSMGFHQWWVKGQNIFSYFYEKRCLVEIPRHNWKKTLTWFEIKKDMHNIHKMSTTFTLTLSYITEIFTLPTRTFLITYEIIYLSAKKLYVYRYYLPISIYLRLFNVLATTQFIECTIEIILTDLITQACHNNGLRSDIIGILS